MWREIVFKEAEGQDVLEISDDRSALLLDPLRWRVLEAVGTGTTLGKLASELEVTDTRLLYHLRLLVDAGVLRMEQASPSARNRLCTPVARRLRVAVRDPVAEDAGTPIPAMIASGFNPGRTRTPGRALRARPAGLSQPQPVATVGGASGRVRSSPTGPHRGVLPPWQGRPIRDLVWLP